jgi:hypothetical protein
VADTPLGLPHRTPHARRRAQDIVLAAIAGMESADKADRTQRPNLERSKQPLLLTAWDPAPAKQGYAVPEEVARDYVAQVCARLAKLKEDGLAMALPGTMCSAEAQAAAAAGKAVTSAQPTRVSSHGPASTQRQNHDSHGGTNMPL